MQNCMIISKGGGNRGARGAMAPLKIFLEGPGPSKITDDPSSVINFYSTLYNIYYSFTDLLLS